MNQKVSLKLLELYLELIGTFFELFRTQFKKTIVPRFVTHLIRIFFGKIWIVSTGDQARYFLDNFY